MTTAPLQEEISAPPAPSSEGFGLADYVGETFLLLGAGSTVLLQMAEPGVGHGVSEHSTVLRRPLDRLRTTMTYVYAVTLGTPEEKQAIVRLTNKAHVPVRTDSYNAFDPELQLWVAATLYKNGAVLYERFFGPLDEETAERIYQQSAVFGTALQVKPEMWPATRAEFEQYWEHKLETLQVDDQVRAFVHDLLTGGDSPLPVKMMAPLIRFVTTGMLPERMRGEFGLAWNPVAQAGFDLMMAALPPVYRLVPRPIRWLPSTYYLWDMRRRLKSNRGIAR